MELNITFRKIVKKVLKKKIVVTVIELEFVFFSFFKSTHALFFLTPSLIDSCCQIVTDACKKCFKICLEVF